jgi:hypothetical protein
MLGLAAVAIFAGRAEAQQPFAPQNPTVTLPCGAIYDQRVSIFGSGVSIIKPAVDFIFYVYPPGPCSVYGVRVNWVYQIANKATQQIAQTVFGSTTYKVLPFPFASITKLTVHCAPKLPNTYCRDAAATLVAGKFPNPPYIFGLATAPLGPVPPY